jgi:hypothetical protein
VTSVKDMFPSMMLPKVAKPNGSVFWVRFAMVARQNVISRTAF